MRTALTTVAQHITAIVRYNASKEQYNGHNSRFSLEKNAPLVSEFNVEKIIGAYTAAITADAKLAEYNPSTPDTGLLQSVLSQYPTWNNTTSSRSTYLQAIDIMLYELHYAAQRREVAPQFAFPRTKTLGTTRAGAEIAENPIPNTGGNTKNSANKSTNATKSNKTAMQTVRDMGNKAMNHTPSTTESNSGLFGTLIVAGVGGGVALGSYKLLSNRASYKGDDNMGKRIMVSAVAGVIAGGITHLVVSNSLNDTPHSPSQPPPQQQQGAKA